MPSVALTPPRRRPSLARRGRCVVNPIERGQAGETAAAHFLCRRGYRLLDRNFRGRCGELDIVALDGETIVFVEVKLRRRLVAALEAVDPRKQRRLLRVAGEYLLVHGWLERQVRFDVIAVDRATMACSHVREAFDGSVG